MIPSLVSPLLTVRFLMISCPAFNRTVRFERQLNLCEKSACCRKMTPPVLDHLALILLLILFLQKTASKQYPISHKYYTIIKTNTTGVS